MVETMPEHSLDGARKPRRTDVILNRDTAIVERVDKPTETRDRLRVVQVPAPAPCETGPPKHHLDQLDLNGCEESDCDSRPSEE
jgi:hypothetical protein